MSPSPCHTKHCCGCCYHWFLESLQSARALSLSLSRCAAVASQAVATPLHNTGSVWHQHSIMHTNTNINTNTNTDIDMDITSMMYVVSGGEERQYLPIMPDISARRTQSPRPPDSPVRETSGGQTRQIFLVVVKIFSVNRFNFNFIIISSFLSTHVIRVFHQISEYYFSIQLHLYSKPLE